MASVAESRGARTSWASYYRAICDHLGATYHDGLECTNGTLSVVQPCSMQNGDGRAIALAVKACSLKEVDLRQLLLGDQGALPFAAVLPACPSLVALRLAHNNLGDSAASAFAAAIGQAKSLQVLDLSHNLITDTGLGAFVSAFRAEASELRELYLQGNVGNSAACGLELAQVPRLRVLGFAPPAEERPALDMACRLRGVQLLDRGPEERQRLAGWMAGVDRSVQKLHQMLSDRTNAQDQRMDMMEAKVSQPEAKVADRELTDLKAEMTGLKAENEELRMRVAGLEQQVGTEQRECQRILEAVLDLSRHARPSVTSASRSASPRAETLTREGSVETRSASQATAL